MRKTGRCDTCTMGAGAASNFGFVLARVNCHIYETHFQGRLIIVAANINNLYPAIDIIKWGARIFELCFAIANTR